MALEQLLPLADGWNTLQQATDALGRGSRVVLLEGVPVPAKGFVLARIAQQTGKPLIVVTLGDEQATRLVADLGAFLPDNEKPLLLPSSLTLLLDDEESGVTWGGRAGAWPR
jgi:excinuclease UvrABC helicase subunit UvrB